jgi:hypothetical protein
VQGVDWRDKKCRDHVEGFMWESVVVIHMKTDEKHNQNIDL